MKSPHRCHLRGMTLVETVVTLIVVSLVASFTMNLVRDLPYRSAHHKLLGDVRELNHSVKVYQAFFGTLDSARTAEDVIEHLKDAAASESAREIADLTGSIIDRRLVLVMITPEESITSMPRAVWSRSQKQFEIVKEGFSGIKRFELEGDVASASLDTGAGTTRGSELSTASNWIWEYTDQRAAGRNDPTIVPISSAAPEIEVSAVSRDAELLKRPEFSVPGGSYSIDDYGLELTISDPNVAGVSKIHYSVNLQPWEVYTGPITVQPSSHIRAYAQSLHPDWRNSGPRTQIYNAIPVLLRSPGIDLSAEKLDYNENQKVRITIDNPNEDLVSNVEYRINEGSWTPYTGPFSLSTFEYYLEGARIGARVIGTEDWYVRSEEVSSIVDRPDPWFEISGDASGSIITPAANYKSAGSLSFKGTGFLEVAPGERFKIGTLDFSNREVGIERDSESVDFSINLVFDGTVNREFHYTLAVIETPNSAGSEQGNADYVRLEKLLSDTAIPIRGERYHLVLEFGETTEKGYSSPAEFHVYEGAAAEGSLYARLELAD